MEPSETQREAIEYLDHPCIISAGAGSGKTFTLTNKFSHLVNLGYEPDRILCITFTNKAANELKERVVKLTNANWFDIQWVRTIHSACLQILKPHFNKLDYHDNVSIYTAYEQRKMIRQVLYSHKLDIKKFTMPIAKLISDAKDTFDPVGFIEKVQLKKYETISTELLPKLKFKRERLVDIFNDYNRTLLMNNAIDFDDILYLTSYLLKNNEEIRETYRNYFQYIMIDEFQDVNNIQYDIIMSLVKDGNLTIVGDDFQSIFGWRGAKPTFFIEAKNEIENAKLFKLEQNYRSSKPIVKMSNDIIKRNKKQIAKVCYSKIDSPIKPKIVKFNNDVEESQMIANACQLFSTEYNYSFNDIAILYRAKFSSRSVERALADMGIPYVIIGSVAFFERREVKDIMSYLKFAFNPNDSESFVRAISVPRRGIGKLSLQKIQQLPAENIMQKIENVLTYGKLKNKVMNNVSSFYSLITKIKNMKPADAIVEVFNSTNFENELRSMSFDDEDYIDRKENIHELHNFASKFEDISGLIDESSLMTSSDDNDKTEKVKLMTVHAAKGLEFKAVFIIGLEDGLFPHWKSIKSDRELKSTDFLEEERRLFYVATTRSESILNMTTVNNRSCSFAGRTSRFINEVRKHCDFIDLTETEEKEEKEE